MIMNDNLKHLEISPSEWISLNQFLHELKQINTFCVSVYYQLGKEKETISLLQQTERADFLEQIESKIEERITEFKKKPLSAGKFTKTVCIFGWMENNKIHIRSIGTSKKLRISIWLLESRTSSHSVTFSKLRPMFY